MNKQSDTDEGMAVIRKEGDGGRLKHEDGRKLDIGGEHAIEYTDVLL